MKSIPNTALAACLALIASASLAFAQTPYPMSTGNFTENFDDIADTAAWPNGFLSTEPWGSVAVNTTGTIPSATSITTSTATLLATDSPTGGVQRGVGNIYLLSTGGNPGNTSSAAIDLLLNFTNRNAGSLSFNAATVFNGAITSNRLGELRLYYTTDGTNWTEITGGGLPYTATNYVAGNQAVSVILPTALNGVSSARFRFYYYNKSSETTVTGSRPKISIDNVLVTSTPAGADTTNPTLVSLSPPNGETAAAIATTLKITLDEPVIAAAGNVSLYASSDPLTAVQTFPASAGTFSGASVTFTPSAPLAYGTNYHVIVSANAFTDSAGNPFAGITTSDGWAFRTAPEPTPIPPSVARLSPANDATSVPAGDVFLEIEYDMNVVRGTGTLQVFDLSDTNVPPTPIASFDVSDTVQVLIENKIVGFALPVPAVAGKTYYVSGPAGLFRSAVGNVNSAAFGFGENETPWAFAIAIPDTTPPALVSTTPQNGPGASVSPVLTASFNEPLTLTASWTVTVFDVTANAPLAEFSNLNPAGVSVGGTQIAITLPAPLAFNNTYRVTLSAGIVKDTAGNPSDAVTGSAWEFTTGGPFVAGQVVISQVYGGGGNAGATFRNDFIELHNKSGSAISLNGWSVQYASSTGTSWAATALTGTIQAGGYYLVQQAAGGGGTENLPTPDASGNIAMSGTNGKVALVNSITPLTGASPLADTSISDFVGYGTANAFEGAGATPTLGNATAAIRLVNGSKDTNNNNLDFITGTPAPRNSSSPVFFPTVDGSGTAIAGNATPGSGSLAGSFIFPSSGANQAVKFTLLGTLAGETLTSASITVPADFGVPAAENITLSGPAAAGASVSVSGQLVTVNSIALTSAAGLEVTISGLAAPDATLSPSDDGFREFPVSTAQAGGTLKPIVLLPKVRVALPVADISNLRAVTLPSPKAYILGSEAVATYVTPARRNQHWIQDNTGGILIDDQPFVLGVSYVRGDGISSLVGTLSEFEGLLQLTPIAAVSTRSSSGNNPAPVAVTLAELAANPLLHQARLVRINGVSFQTTPASFTTESIHTLTQGSDTFSFRSFTGVDYIANALPTTSFDLIGLVRRVGATPVDYVSARSLADFITTPVILPGYQDWARDFAGNQAANLDFDGDDVPNGVEYFFGVKTAGFTPTPGIVNGKITFPRDASLTDVSFVVQTSGDLLGWDDVLVENLDLTDPNFITYLVPNAPSPFFVRIKVTVTPPAS